MVDDTQIPDAQIVTEEDEEGNIVSVQKKGDTTPTTASDILDLTALINRYVADIEKTKNQLKEQKQMFKDTFENDKEYHDKNEIAKSAIKEKNAVKQRIMRQPAVQTLSEKVQELQSQMKEMHDALSGYLQEHIRVTGQRTIEGADGEMREIVPVYKLVKKRE